MSWLSWLSRGWKVGDIYSISKFDPKGFRAAKVLRVEENGVHLRIYKQVFERRPRCIDPHSLTLGTIHDPDGFGMGHIPVTKRRFESWAPSLLAKVEVRADELEGYEYWKENSDGSFFDLGDAGGTND